MQSQCIIVLNTILTTNLYTVIKTHKVPNVIKLSFKKMQNDGTAEHILSLQSQQQCTVNISDAICNGMVSGMAQALAANGLLNASDVPGTMPRASTNLCMGIAFCRVS